MNPAVTNSPDLSKWYFNKVLGLGSPEWNTKIRDIREKSRFVRNVESQKFWNIDKQVKELKKMQQEEEEQKRFQARRNLIGESKF